MYYFSPVLEYVKYLEPLFQLDRLLPRTLIAVMKFQNLDESFIVKIPIEVCLANLSYFVKKNSAAMDCQVFLPQQLLAKYSDIIVIYLGRIITQHFH